MHRHTILAVMQPKCRTEQEKRSDLVNGPEKYRHIEHHRNDAEYDLCNEACEHGPGCSPSCWLDVRRLEMGNGEHRSESPQPYSEPSMNHVEQLAIVD